MKNIFLLLVFMICIVNGLEASDKVVSKVSTVALLTENNINSFSKSAETIFLDSDDEGTITASATSGDGYVTLSWTTSDIDIRNIQIMRNSTSSTSGRTRIGAAGSDDTSYTDEDVTNGTTYYYWIKIVDTDLNTYNSDVVEATPEEAEGIITLTTEEGDGAVVLNWSTENIDDISSIQIYRDTDSDASGRTRIGYAGSDDSSYTDSDVSNGTTYYYWVKIIDGDSNTYNSDAVDATPSTLDDGTITATATEGDGFVYLSWSADDLDIRNIQIMRNTSAISSGRTRIGTAGTDDTSYTDTDVSNGTTYYYWVKIVDTDLESHNSGAIEVTPSSDGEEAATLTKHGSGSSSQTVTSGSSITEFYYIWENATSVTVSGMPGGITTSIDTDEQTVTFSGTPTETGEFDYTITTTGGYSNVSVNGTITVTELNTGATEVGCHDPSSIIECDGKYYMFGTGEGIAMVSSSSPSFDSYTVETSPFADGDPDWVYDYVEDFEGNYWAPECIYMNDKYYLYYSVSMGDAECAIGLVTTPSLSDPEWTDQGMVVYSDDDTEYGSIDPDVFIDEDDNVWMAFGSHLVGIWLVQLNASTGKTLNSDFYHIVTSSDAEAAHLEYNDGYYYVFYNQNTCCDGLESDYAISMGRSTSITGTYYDLDGNSLNDGGGTVFLETDGRYVGPGHFGYGEGVLSYHFYDGNNYGTPMLMISSLSWEDGWPVAETFESGGATVSEGTYSIENVNSGLLLDLENCDTDDGANVQQYEDLDNDCQRWTITEAENGYYNIESVYSGLLLDVVNCGFSSGTDVDVWSDLSNVCQQWRFEEQDDGSYRIVSRKNGKDLEVGDGDTSNGANVQTYAMTGATCQYWTLSKISSSSVSSHNFSEDTKVSEESDISIYPNPVENQLTIQGAEENASYTIYKMDGQVMQKGNLNGNIISVDNMASGMYILSINFVEGGTIKFNFVKK